MKSLETKIAEKNVDVSIAQFESAVNHLIDKVECTSNVVSEAIDVAKEKIETAVEKYEHVRETIEKPVIFAKDFADRANAMYRDVEAKVRANPEPYVSWAAFAFGMFLCYRALRNHRRALTGSKVSWAQQEP